MQKESSFTQGSILAPLMRFALPVLGALILQAMYGAVDLLVVGQFGTPAGVSAVSTGSQLMHTITTVITGLSMGTTVLLGQHIGAGSDRRAGDIIGGAICLFAFLGALLTAVVTLSAEGLCALMHAPEEAFHQTVQYVSICAGGSLFIVAYNVLGSVFRGMGDSRTPLLAVIIACVVNVLGWSIPEIYVNYVVEVPAIGNPKGIVSGTTKITRDPVGLVMAQSAVEVIRHSGLLKDGFSFQTGAGGASLAAAKFLMDVMVKDKIQGSFASGGITGYLVDMLNAGCFRSLMDVQCFDLKAVESIRTNPAHQEISAMHYASPAAASAVVDNLDVVILGATEVDTDFNVNVHTDSNGYIMGGSGGHSDTAAGAKLSMIIAPLFRARLPIVTDRVSCISTPGRDIDVLVTQRGIAVNPKNGELMQRLKDGGLNIVDIHELKEIAERITGKPEKITRGDRKVANVIYRDGTQIDEILSVK